MSASNQRQLARLLVYCGLLEGFLLVSPIRASESFRDEPLCGVSCVYASGVVLRHPLDFNSLLRPELIGSRAGSTIEEVCKAATVSGLHARAIARMTTIDLRRLEFPAILHVRARPWSKRCDHYVLYIGAQGDRAIIVDPGNGRFAMGFPALARMWDGTAVVVSNSPVSPAYVTWFTWFLMINSALLSLLLLRIVGHWVSQRHFSLGPEVLLILMAAGIAGGAYQYLAPGGLLADERASREVEEWHTSAFLPKSKIKDVRAALGNSTTVLIDARSRDAYDTGHIPGAINVPVASLLTRDSDVPKFGAETRVIVYCVDTHCDSARIAAQRLISVGNCNVSVFEGGWDEWVAVSKVAR